MKCDTSNRLDVSVLVIGEYSYTRVSLTKSVPIGKAGLQDPFDWGQKGWHVPSGPVTAISCSHTRTYINTNYMQSQQQACLWETFVVYLLKWTRKKKKKKIWASWHIMLLQQKTRHVTMWIKPLIHPAESRFLAALTHGRRLHPLSQPTKTNGKILVQRIHRRCSRGRLHGNSLVKTGTFTQAALKMI